MPNWCSNYVVISHEDKEKMVNLIESINNEKFFDFFKPIDKKLYETEEWYDWCIENWGTKWDAIMYEKFNEEDIIESEDGKFVISFSFDTAWGPPIKAMIEGEKKGYRIELEFEEPGVGFAGNFFDGKTETWGYVDKGEDLAVPF